MSRIRKGVIAAVAAGTVLLIMLVGGSRSDTAIPSPQLDESAILPSLTADRDLVLESPISEKCFKCHGTEVASLEWAKSGHAHNLAALRASPNGRSSCLACHSSGFRPLGGALGEPSFDYDFTLDTAINEVACSSCHSHAFEERESYLVRPVGELCASCHRMDCGCAGKGLIHQSQSEMFRGSGGRGVPPQPSNHTIEMDGNCAVCHMYKADEAQETVVEAGGHTFKATLESCTPCHDDAAIRLEEARESVVALVAQVETALDKVIPSDWGEPAYGSAAFNLALVRGDGGIGLHNPTYAKALLEQSLRFLDVEGEPPDTRDESR